jgi:hypothetical protein
MKCFKKRYFGAHCPTLVIQRIHKNWLDWRLLLG